jgi:hypothetical protein
MCLITLDRPGRGPLGSHRNLGRHPDWLLGTASVLPGVSELTGWLTSAHVQATDLSVAGPSRHDWREPGRRHPGSAFTCRAATPADRAWPVGCGRWPASGRRSRGTSRSAPAPRSSSTPWPAAWRRKPACPVPRSGCSARCPLRPWCSSRPSRAAGRKPGRRGSRARRRCSRRCGVGTTPASRTVTCGRAACSRPGTGRGSARLTRLSQAPASSRAASTWCRHWRRMAARPAPWRRCGPDTGRWPGRRRVRGAAGGPRGRPPAR